MEKTNITIRTTKEILACIKAKAGRMGISRNSYINLLLIKEAGVNVREDESRE